MAKRRDVVQWMAGTSLGFAVPLLTATGCRREATIVPKGAKQPTARVGSASASLAKPAAIVTPAPKQVKIPISQYRVRKSEERGKFKLNWLDAKHSFSFGRYYDPRNMGFRALRVLNEDKIRPGGGFPMHPHNNMEIVTYILDGALQHRDSIGNGSVIRPGEIQRMSAGTGIRHSEFNPSGLAPVHLLQIWLTPDKRGHKPSYAQQVIPQISSPDPVRLIASPDGFNGSVSINQDVRIYACHVARGQELQFEVRKNRHAWLQMAKGTISLKGALLKQGDGLSTSDDGWIIAQATEPAELLIFDLV